MRRVSLTAGVAATALLVVHLQGIGTVPTYAPLVDLFGTGGQAQESATADFNCDGKPDVVLLQGKFATPDQFPIRIFGNNGTGGMTDISAQVITGAAPTVVWPRKMLVDDFNGDGRADVFVADTGRDLPPFPGYQNQLLLSTDDCHLVSRTATHLPQQNDYSHSAAAADIDADGDLDLYVGNVLGGQPPQIGPQIWLNDGTGHFTISGGRLPATIEDVHQDSYTSAGFADVDADGDPDLVLGGSNFSANAVALNDGAGHFALLAGAMPAKPFAPTANVLDVQDFDINHDGFTDLLLSVTKNDPYYQGRWIQVLINNGNGTFHDETASRMPQADNLNTWLIFIDLLDVDGDGNLDAVGKVPYHNASGDHKFMLSNAAGVFTSVNLTAVGSNLSGVFSYVDVNNNGHRDLLSFGDVFTSLMANNGPVLPPGQPRGVRVSTTLPDRVRVFWRYVWGATQYEVWRSATPGGAQTLVGTTANTTIDDLGASTTPMYYVVKAVNGAGTSAASAAVAGSMVTAPHITGHPADQTVALGLTATFSAVASGNPSPSYRWQVSADNGGSWTDLTAAAPYSGTQSPTLTVTPVTAPLSGLRYRAVISNSAGSVATASARLSILSAPTISAPADQQVAVGGTATFQVTAGGNPAPALQWQLSSNGGASWLNLGPDATYGGTYRPTLTVSNAVAGYNGAKFRCVATNIAGSVTSAVATLTVGAAPPPPPPPPPPTAINLSRDLITYGIASKNAVPNTPTLDARPLFAAAMAYAWQHHVASVTADPGSYYFLSQDASDRFLNLFGMSDITLDLAGSTIFLKTGFMHGVILTECARMTLKNFTIDYLTPPYTHVTLSSVTPAARTLSYSPLSGFADPTTFNGVASPYGPLELWAVAFRNGAMVPGTSRMRIQAPIVPGTLQLAPENSPWTQAETLATLHAGDTLVLTQRGGGSPVEIFRGDAIVVSNVTVQGSSWWAVSFDQVTNSTADGVRIVPRPGSGLIGSNADGIHFTSARQNNQIRNSFVSRTLDDAIAMDSLYLATVLQRTGARQVHVRRSGWWRFANDTSVTFVSAATAAEIGGGVITSQTPADADNFNAEVDVSFDRDLPALAAGDGMVFGTASQRGGGSAIADNIVTDISYGRGIWLGGSRGVTIERNRIRGTSSAGIAVSQSTTGPTGPPARDIVIQDNEVAAALGPMASGGSGYLSFAAIQVSAMDGTASFAHAATNTGITVRRNFVADSGHTGIWMGETDGGSIDSNVVVRWNRHPELPAWGLNPEGTGFAAADFPNPIVLRFSTNVSQTGNSTLADSTLPAAVSAQPALLSVNRHATSGSVAVQTNVPALAWRARSNTSWLTITAGQSGTGAGSVSWSVSENSTGAARSATITIADADIPVTQSATETAAPTIALDRSEINFAGTSNGAALVAVTPPQSVRLVSNGSSAANWSASSNQPWLQVSPPAGAGTSTLSLAIAAGANLPPGTFEAVVSIGMSGVTGAVATMTVRLAVQPRGATGAPIGSFDTPLDGATGVTGSIAVTGWTVDDIGVTAVRILRDPVDGEPAGQLIPIGNAVFVEGARNDIVTGYPTMPANGRAGWGYLMLTNFLPHQGNGTFRLYAIADDVDGHSTVLGTKTITCANSASTAPFGAIDTPAQGETVSGALINFGWTLIKAGARADTPGGATVQALIDGVPAGAPSEWTGREDLTRLFPDGFSDLTSTLAVLAIDTTKLANGVHTIAWVVTATNGQAAGIGSRYFTVSNGALVLGGSAAREPAQPRAYARTQHEITGRRGFDLAAPYRSYEPGPDGVVVVQAEELDRIDLRTGAAGASLVTSSGVTALPAGSHLDAQTGVFTWQPGVGFSGPYDFALDAQRVRIVLNPKGSNRVGPQTAIDTPASSAGETIVSLPFVVAGWAADLDAAWGPGVDAVHVWAYPVAGDGRYGSPVFLGAAEHGGARPDVAAIYGDRFKSSGYGLAVRALDPGVWDVAVFAHSSVTGEFAPARLVRITVR